MVLGHLLEIAGGIPGRKILYDVIYSFHVPAFLFLSGMFARLDRGRFLFGLCLPYLALQVLYLSWARLLGEQQTQLEFARPYWLLWYLFALMVYHVCCPSTTLPAGRDRCCWWQGPLHWRYWRALTGPSAIPGAPPGCLFFSPGF